MDVVKTALASSTHYFLPIFKTIQMPKKGVHHYNQRIEESVVGAFNWVQGERVEELVQMVVSLHG